MLVLHKSISASSILKSNVSRRETTPRNKAYFSMNGNIYKYPKMNFHNKSTNSLINLSYFKKQNNENTKQIDIQHPFHLPILNLPKIETEKVSTNITEHYNELDINNKLRNQELPKVLKIFSSKKRRNSYLANIKQLPNSIYNHKQSTYEIEKSTTPKQIEFKNEKSLISLENKQTSIKGMNIRFKPSKLILNNKMTNIANNNKYNYIVSSFSIKGSKSINQDAILIQDNIFNIEDFSIFSVFDGHGQNGHFISNLAKNKFNQHFSNDSTLYYIPRQVESSSSLIESYTLNLKSLKKYVTMDLLESKLCLNNYRVINSVYSKIEKEIKNEIQFDKEFSGTTACSVFLIGNTIICSNIGDSRAIIINNNKKEYKLLSNDHKPNLPQEKNRIMKSGGEVRKGKAYKDNDEDVHFPYRVYEKGKDYPGLAMSRSLGDLIAKSVGVSNEPEIIKTVFQENDLGIVIATDGLWEFVSNEEVGEVVRKNINKCKEQKNCEIIVNELCELARKRFLQKGNYVDDISIIVVIRK